MTSRELARRIVDMLAVHGLLPNPLCQPEATTLIEGEIEDERRRMGRAPLTPRVEEGG